MIQHIQLIIMNYLKRVTTFQIFYKYQKKRSKKQMSFGTKKNGI